MQRNAVKNTGGVRPARAPHGRNRRLHGCFFYLSRRESPGAGNMRKEEKAMSITIEAEFPTFDEADYAARALREALGEEITSVKLRSPAFEGEKTMDQYEIFPFLNRNSSAQSMMPMAAVFKRYNEDKSRTSEIPEPQLRNNCWLHASVANRVSAKQAERIMRSNGGLSISKRGG